MTVPLLDVRDLECSYASGTRRLPFSLRPTRAVVHGVSFAVHAGETVALVGESGSGKTTIARTVAGLIVPTGGEILFNGGSLPRAVGDRPKEVRRQIQYVFQNPDSSLNPRRRISSILGRPLELFFGLSGRAKQDRIEQLLRDVHLDPGYGRRFPVQLSGGERQRIAIAQALAAEPKLVLCDEVVSALDVSVQAAILDLLRELQAKRGVSYLFITHDLAVVRWLAHRVIVLYRGHVMEAGRADEVFSPPVHPYTEMLLNSVPDPASKLRLLAESAPSLPSEADAATFGCPFSHACPRRLGTLCDEERPPRRELGETHSMLCHIPAPELARVQRFAWTGPAGRHRAAGRTNATGAGHGGRRLTGVRPKEGFEGQR